MDAVSIKLNTFGVLVFYGIATQWWLNSNWIDGLTEPIKVHWNICLIIKLR